jgi:2-keto-4-pentenoate hydratase
LKATAMTDIHQAAEIIARARTTRTPLPPLPAGAELADLSQAYDVQDRLHGLLQPHLGGIVGYKIGCTSEVMQKYLSIAHPCAGGVFASRVLDSGATLPAASFVRMGVECEIAARLGKDLPRTGERITAEDVADAIDAYFPAIEIVDDRYVKWQTLGAPTLVADDFFGSAIVLGKPMARATAPDLRTVLGRAVINGSEVGRGTGADLMGHPNNPVAWLANHLADRGDMLRAGQVVMTGSSVQTVWLQAGDKVSMEFSDLGNVQFHLT